MRQLLVLAACLIVTSYSLAPVTNIKKTLLNDDVIHFLLAGDFGGWPPPFFTTPTQHKVAAKMGEVAERVKTDFVLALGDNFYFLGVKDEHDQRFKLTYEDVYNASSLQHIPWHPTMGNHDWHGSAKAQLEYSRYSSRWTYPWYWYSIDYSLASTDTTLRVVMMDTTIQCGINAGGTPINDTQAEEQWKWVEGQLDESKDMDYVMVVGHFPLFAAGTTGPVIECLNKRLKPMLDKYKVSAYIAGHEHSLEHLRDINHQNTEYFIVGCSNFVSPTFRNKDSDKFTLMYSWGEMDDLGGCFGRVEVTKDGLKVIMVQGRDGAEVYSHVIKPRSEM